MNTISIGNISIGSDQPPLIIAEMSGNHNHSLERALAIVDAVADSGAQAIKLQTYTPDTMTLDVDQKEFRISSSESIWKGKTLYQLYKEAYTPWEWHIPIFEHAQKRGLLVFSTPFDESSVDFLETLNVPCYKIASYENTDLPLLRKVAATGKPMFISTGMATVGELDEAVRTVREAGCEDVILLKCVSAYPASPETANLLTIPHIAQLFNAQIGLSDHTIGIGVAIAAVALGATVIEKHFTLSRADGGVDALFSLEPSELSTLVQESHRAKQALGRIWYGPASQTEARERNSRRSLYIVRDMRHGEHLECSDIRAIRPGLGLPPKWQTLVLGATLKKDVQRGTPLSWDLLF